MKKKLLFDYISLTTASELMFGDSLRLNTIIAHGTWKICDIHVINDKKYFKRNEFFKTWKELCNCSCLVSSNYLKVKYGLSRSSLDLFFGELPRYGSLYKKQYFSVNDVNELFKRRGIKELL